MSKRRIVAVSSSESLIETLKNCKPREELQRTTVTKISIPGRIVKEKVSVMFLSRKKCPSERIVPRKTVPLSRIVQAPKVNPFLGGGVFLKILSKN